MNKNVTRLGLAVIAAFYVVIGGLWAVSYFPLQKVYAVTEAKTALVEKIGYERAHETKEYKEATAYQERYVMSNPDIVTTEGRLAFYQSLLLWGTVAIGAGGGVLFLTRGRGAQSTNGGTQ